MTDREAHEIAEAVVASLRAVSAKSAAAALDKARALAQLHCPKNPQQPVKHVREDA